MSFSNADTGDKPADPYKATNLTDPNLEEKVKDLVKFMEACKFGMMTTRIGSTGMLTSRCMALAAKVGITSHIHALSSPQKLIAHAHRRVTALISYSIPTPSPAKQMT